MKTVTAKPDEIPQDVWDAAVAVVGMSDGLGYAKVQAASIAHAIMAERERASNVVVGQIVGISFEGPRTLLTVDVGGGRWGKEAVAIIRSTP